MGGYDAQVKICWYLSILLHEKLVGIQIELKRKDKKMNKLQTFNCLKRTHEVVDKYSNDGEMLIV